MNIGPLCFSYVVAPVKTDHSAGGLLPVLCDCVFVCGAETSPTRRLRTYLGYCTTQKNAEVPEV